MKNLNRLALAGALLVAGTAYATTSIVRSQEGGQEVDMEAMMAEMMKLATPGPQHKLLTDHAGEWNQAYKFRMGPDAPWTDSKGTSSAKAVLGGRYLLDEVDMNMMGMPMTGLHLIGFDNRSQEYISLWADSMGTWWTTTRGKANEKGVIELKGTMSDVAGDRPFRMTIEYRDDGSVYSEMFDTIPPHGEVKMMTYTSTPKG